MQSWSRLFVLCTIAFFIHFIIWLRSLSHPSSLTVITSHFDFKDAQNVDLSKERPNPTNTSLPADATVLPTGTNSSSDGLGGLHTELPPNRRANATFVILAKNSDLNDLIKSVRAIEDRFNRDRHYPYVFLNEVPFTNDFKKRVSVLSKASMEFGMIPRDHWFQPKWIDETKARKSRNMMTKQRVIYGGSVTYRNMCRYNSGFFFKHELLQKYRWYWRIEPNVKFHCDIDYDPFLFMEDNDKVYGFTIALYEIKETIETLWSHVRNFIVDHPEYLSKDHSMQYLSNDLGRSYNLCHFWSNFEIADLDFWRGEAYTKFFEYLDAQGGFYYERWGDAPVHSIGASLFARKDQLHFFEDIGYEHNPHVHCPKDPETWKRKQCSCNPSRNIDYTSSSCLKIWESNLEQQ